MLMSRHHVLTLFVLIATMGVVLLWLFDPAHSHIFPPCPVHYFTGLYCPGCGSLRAIHALLHGDLRQAWAMNALTITMLPLIAYGSASEIHMRFRSRPLLAIRVPANWIRALFALIVLFGIARNLPFHPFDWLAPGALMHL
ncbi:MAG TPA: DUF2752 domain-containing protein [Candidatus Binatia bacterium]|nr:DUF2752 domain-containing protein [Candidatus Binatia bacterium]